MPAVKTWTFAPLDDPGRHHAAVVVGGKTWLLHLPAHAYHLTDLGQAERIADWAGDLLRYVPDRDTWRVWRDGHWRDDVNGDRWAIAIAVARAVHIEAEAYHADQRDDDGARRTSTPRARAHAWAYRSESGAGLSAALELASTIAPIAAPAATWDAEPRWPRRAAVATPDADRTDGVVNPRSLA